jgi:hypothetical protein
VNTNRTLKRKLSKISAVSVGNLIIIRGLLQLRVKLTKIRSTVSSMETPEATYTGDSTAQVTQKMNQVAQLFSPVASKNPSGLGETSSSVDMTTPLRRCHQELKG